MKKIFGMIAAIAAVAAFWVSATPLMAQVMGPTRYEINSLSPSWDNAAGVYSAYYGPNNNYTAVSPGQTAVYTDLVNNISHDAGIIKAGINIDIEGCGLTMDYCDEGLFAFIPTGLTTTNLAAGPLNYYVVNQSGENSVWMTIEIDTGKLGDRNDNVTYECVPVPGNQDTWHLVDVTTDDCLWDKWTTDPLDGSYTGVEEHNYTLDDVVNDALIASDIDTGSLDVVRVYLRLGMGDTYHGIEEKGTVAWVNKVEIGNTVYDFVKPLQAGKN